VKGRTRQGVAIPKSKSLVENKLVRQPRWDTVHKMIVGPAPRMPTKLFSHARGEPSRLYVILAEDGLIFPEAQADFVHYRFLQFSARPSHLSHYLRQVRATAAGIRRPPSY